MSQKKEINCLNRLNTLTGSINEIVTFLLEEKLLDKSEATSIVSSSDVAKSLNALLHRLNELGKIQLIEYEWVILPVERIKIHIVTLLSNREFVYNF